MQNKKSKIAVHIVANVIIIAVIFGLYLMCVPTGGAVAASAPIYNGDRQGNKVALMINVYENSAVVDAMMDTLEKYNAVATFFVGGIWAEKNLPLVKKMQERNEVGNHGYLHKDHAKLSLKQNLDEIMLCHKLVEKGAGLTMNLFAPPSGSIGNNMLKTCIETGYKVIMWSKDTIDWRDKDYNLVFKRATTGTQGGDLILMHPTEHTLKALPLILRNFEENGLKCAHVSDVINGLGGM